MDDFEDGRIVTTEPGDRGGWRRLACRLVGHAWDPWRRNRLGLSEPDLAEMGWELLEDRICAQCGSRQIRVGYG